MDDQPPSARLNEWDHLFNGVYVALEHKKHNRDSSYWRAYEEMGRVVSLFPTGERLSQVQIMMLTNALEHGCFMVPLHDDETKTLRDIAIDVLRLIDPWREDDDGFSTIAATHPDGHGLAHE